MRNGKPRASFRLVVSKTKGLFTKVLVIDGLTLYLKAGKWPT